MSRSRMSSISTVTASVGVRIGGLWKRSQGLSRFTKPNYKHRVFILTDQSLSYYAGTVDVSPTLHIHTMTICVARIQHCACSNK